MTGPTRRGMLGVTAASIAPLPAIAASMAPNHPDAELLRIGAIFDSAAAEERAAWHAAEHEVDEGPKTKTAMRLAAVTTELVRQIERIQALTLAGLLVKMRAFGWCRCWEPVTAECLSSWEGNPATDARLLAGVLNDLAAMGRAGS